MQQLKLHMRSMLGKAGTAHLLTLLMHLICSWLNGWVDGTKWEWVRERSATDKNIMSSLWTYFFLFGFCVFLCVFVLLCEGSIGHTDVSIDFGSKGERENVRRKLTTHIQALLKPNNPN